MVYFCGGSSIIVMFLSSTISTVHVVYFIVIIYLWSTFVKVDQFNNHQQDSSDGNQKIKTIGFDVWKLWFWATMRSCLKSGTVFLCVFLQIGLTRPKLRHVSWKLIMPLENYCEILVAMFWGYCPVYIVLHIACVQYLLFRLCGVLALNISSC